MSRVRHVKVHTEMNGVSSMRILGLVMAVWLLTACDPDAQADAAVRGGSGESCSSRSDCERGLICLDNRCLSTAAAQSESDAGKELATDTRGSAGESCTRRADCSTNLLCIANVCVESVRSDTGMQSPLGERGESCQARNDCATGLACVMNRCVVGESMLTVHAKQCFRVQCELDEDCCKSFVAPITCPTWKQSCSAGDQAACSSYNAACVCSQQCQNSTCIPVRKCTQDPDCTATNERCHAGKCAQCGSDSDCTLPGQRCVSSVCRAGCERNEQCPVFSDCQAGQCVKVGCKSDRECYFATKSPLARCQSTECITPCDTDAQCPDLHVCRAARCVFAGCETDAECRVLLNLSGQPGNDRAMCRLPDR